MRRRREEKEEKRGGGEREERGEGRKRREPSSKNVCVHTGLYADGHIWHIPFFAKLKYGESYLVCQVLNFTGKKKK